MSLTYKELHSQLTYNKSTGKFIWCISNSNRVKIGDIAGRKDKDGYNTIGINGKQYRANRLVILYVDGYLPENWVDHKDGIISNDRYLNLREVSPQCNARNRTKLNKNNTSGVPGVHFFKRTQKWQSKITVNRKGIHLGYFKDFVNAVVARWKGEKKYNFTNCMTTSKAYLYLKENHLLEETCYL